MTTWFGRSVRDLLKKQPVLSAAVGIGLLCSLLAVFFLDQPASDLASYYGPLAREFAAGNYQRAFFHLIPPLVPLLAGLLAKLGVGEFAALKIVSAAFLLAGLRPLQRLLRRQLPPELVQWGCLLYIACPRLLRYGTMGTLEGAKVFFLLYVVERTLALAEQPGPRRIVELGIGLAGLGLSRGEGVAFIPPIALLVLGLCLRPQGERTLTARLLKGAGNALAVLLVCLAVCSPWIVYQYRVTGFPSLDSRQVWAVRGVLAKVGLAEPTPPLSPAPAGAVWRSPEHAEDALSPMRNIREGVKGLFPVYLALVAIGLLGRLRRDRRSWTWLDWLCVTVIAYNFLVFAATGFVTKRYTSPTIPFLLAWAVLGGRDLLAFLLGPTPRPQWRRGVVGLLVLMGLVICVGDGMSKVRRSIRPKKPDVSKPLGQWVRENAGKLDVNPLPSPAPATWGAGYYAGRQPVVAACRPQYAFRAGTDWGAISNDYLYPYSAVVALCEASRADLLVADRYFLEACPDFEKANRDFELISDQWAAVNVRVYTFRPGSGTAANPAQGASAAPP